MAIKLKAIENPYRFLAPLAKGLPAGLCHGLVSVMHTSACVNVSVSVLTFILNIFNETNCPILIKFYRNVPAMVLL